MEVDKYISKIIDLSAKINLAHDETLPMVTKEMGLLRTEYRDLILNYVGSLEYELAYIKGMV